MLRTNRTTPDHPGSIPPAAAPLGRSCEHRDPVRAEPLCPGEAGTDDGFLDNGGRLFCDPLAY